MDTGSGKTHIVSLNISLLLCLLLNSAIIFLHKMLRLLSLSLVWVLLGNNPLQLITISIQTLPSSLYCCYIYGLNDGLMPLYVYTGRLPHN
jgi:hypothetical protein